MKKLIILFFAIAASINFALADDSGTCGDNLQWYYNSTTHELTITGSGDMTNFNSVPWTSYRDEITSVSLSAELTSIGRYAFQGCTSLSNVNIPNTVTSIGSYAFGNCTSLTSITIPNNVTDIDYYAFSGCTGLTSVTIGESVTNIGNNIFYGCTELTSIVWNAVNFPNVENADRSPFSLVREQIISFTFGENLQEIPAFLCYGMYKLESITIPDNVTSIGKKAFSYCTKLTTVTIPNNVISIDEAAFSYCTKLTNFTFGDGMINLGKEAFSGCTSLSSINMGNSVTSIGAKAFSDCRALTNVTIPNSVTDIGGGAFYQCSGLTSIVIPNSVTSLGEWAFYNCSALTNVTIPDGVTSIGNKTFYWCSNLTNVTIPNSVTSIGEDAFYRCTNLTNITLPNSLTSIGREAFYDCSGITSITIPNYVTSIGENAFQGCTGLTTVVWNAEYGPEISSYGSSPFYKIRTQITSFTFGSNVKSIPAYLCAGLTNLTSISIPSSVTRVRTDAFSGCSNITECVIPDLAAWCKIFFESATSNPLNYVKRVYVAGTENEIRDLVIPDGVTNTGSYNFVNCTRLNSVTFPTLFLTIGEGCFSGCSRFTTVSLPAYMRTVGKYTFNNCTNLVTVNSYNTVPPAIGTSAFPQSVTIYVPHNSFDAYDDSDWGFYNLMPMFVLNVSVNDANAGVASVNGTTINATANYGYHFTGWSDGVNDAQRTIQLTSDSTLTAIFEPNQYQLVLQANETMGTVAGAGTFAYMSNCEISATANYGYNFVGWSDGVTQSTRTIELVKDTTLTAMFEIDQTMACGDNLLWLYNSATHELVITGSGAMNDWGYNSYAPWYQYRYEITSVSLPDGLTSIGAGAFYECMVLTSVTIPNSVTSIGEGAFQNCVNLRNVIIPNSVTSIGAWAFFLCIGATSITIPNSVTNIGNNAFRPVPNLVYNGTATGSPWGARSVNGYVDGYLVYNDASKTQLLACSSLAIGEIDIPNSVTSIGESAFVDCTGLTNVTIPESVTSIGDWAFQGCINFNSMVIPDGVTSIGDGVFYWCTSLTNIKIPNSVTNIGEYAFSNCTALTCVTVPMENPPVINANVFEECGDLSAIYCFVPSGSLSLYQAANVWSSFHLVGIEEATVVADETTATVSAPFSTSSDVASYSLTLYNHGEVFCTLTLDAEGHLIGIDFAQSQQRAAAFASSVNGLNIPITGLQPGTTYTYTLDALDSNGNIIERHAGEFTTEGATALENVSAGSMDNGVRKVIEDGKVVIVMPDGRKFDASGKKLR